MMRKLICCLAATIAAALILTLVANRSMAAAGSAFVGFPCPSNAALTCVMKQLDGVRGLVFGPEGALYVAEAGHGGSGPCGTESGVRVCYGPTGAITRLWDDVQERVLTGLPSLAINDPAVPARQGQTANGPTDLAFTRSGDEQDEGDPQGDDDHGGWKTYVTIGLRNDPRIRADLGPAGAGFAQLLRVAPNGKGRFIGDLGNYEIAANPDEGPIDSNPFGLLFEHGSRLVVDSGANALVRVAANGHGPISTVATFPSRAQGRGTDAVPTSIAVGSDGAYYVSELTGVPFGTWNASVYRVVPGEAPSVYIDGFRMIIDIAFDADWNLYVLQYATVPGTTPGGLFGRSGVLTRITPDGSRTNVITGLRQPTSVAVGPDGFLYVTNVGNLPAVGEVIRVEAPAP
jgi:hypothetical protein